MGPCPVTMVRICRSIGALGLQGMVAALSIEGAVDTDVFDVFVRRVLVPALRPGDVVLLDNLNVHHASCIERAVRAAQGQVIFLPSYSPDFSPIEPCWAKVKPCLRGAAARTRPRCPVPDCRRLTPNRLRGWRCVP